MDARLVFLLACAIVLVVVQTKTSGRPGMIDVEGYVVRDRDDAPQVAALLARLSRNVDTMLAAGPQKDARIKRLKTRWGISALEESPPSAGSIAHAIGKSSIALCLRAPDGTLADENTAMFVLIHELAHLATPQYGHTPQFWDAMQFLLEVAEAAGVYTYVHHGRTEQFDHVVGFPPVLPNAQYAAVCTPYAGGCKTQGVAGDVVERFNGIAPGTATRPNKSPSTELFGTAPYKAQGDGILRNPDTFSKLRYSGYNPHCAKTLGEVNFDRFECINVQLGVEDERMMGPRGGAGTRVGPGYYAC